MMPLAEVEFIKADLSLKGYPTGKTPYQLSGFAQR